MKTAPISSVQPKQNPVKKAAKVVAGAALSAGVIAAGLVAGSKTDAFTKAGKFVSSKIGEGKGQEIVSKVAEKLTTAGKAIEVGGTKLLEMIKTKASTYKVKDSTLYKEAGKLAQDTKTVAKDIAKQLKDANIPEKAKGLIDQLKQQLM